MSRVSCEHCGQWMYHLAKSCPHCGAVRGGAEEVAEAPGEPKERPPLKLSPEEAKALLAVDAAARASEPSPEQGLLDTVVWRTSPLDKALTVLAFPVTVLAVLAIGLALAKARRWGVKVSWEGARWLAVPTTASLGWVALDAAGSSTAATAVLGTSLGAYFVRALLRRRTSPGAALARIR